MKYGQYCPVAKSLEVLGDRWTLLILREFMTGATHFGEIERGLPGISRALLSARLRHLAAAGLIVKHAARGRAATEYSLAQAGRDLAPVIAGLAAWGEQWAFGEPEPADLNPVLLMWWLRKKALAADLPPDRKVAQFDMTGAAQVSFWLLLRAGDVTLCLTDPGFPVDLLVTADLAALYRVWGGRLGFAEALRGGAVRVEGTPALERAFPGWFGWTPPRRPVRKPLRPAEALR